MYILGISGYYHDSAAALILNGEIVAAAQEERFTRKKHDAGFPKKAIEYCLKEAGITIKDLKYVAFYDKPIVKFERLLETYFACAPLGFQSFSRALPVWLKEKLFLKKALKEGLSEIDGCSIKELPQLLFGEHHQSHAASAFFPSPYKEAAVLCLDGVGEWATTSVWHGNDNKLELKWEINFPHSLGLLYSAFTYYAGFKVNSGEYKLMGLAPYGEPKYVREILENLVDVKEDGTFHLDMSYFDFATGLKMTNSKFDALFGGPARKPESRLEQKHMDLARSIQVVTEEIVLKLCKTIQKELKTDYLCLAGGVALNCVANGRLLREGPFKEIWIQPAAGDAGGALGAALSVWHDYLGNHKTDTSDGSRDHMRGSYLGPRFSRNEIASFLKSIDAPAEEVDDQTLITRVADILDDGNVVGWFQGRMEFGPRSLGCRSIIGDSRNREMQTKMNLKIKYRESFRPFAPAVLAEDVGDYFEMQGESPYMLLVAPVKTSLRLPLPPEHDTAFGIDKLRIQRSKIPAVTHVDFSARVQTVHKETNPKFHKLLETFKRKTGTSTIVNTSFNVRGEPIVCSPEDAYRCFMRTEMDYLILDNFILDKRRQPTPKKDDSWQREFELD